MSTLEKAGLKKENFYLPEPKSPMKDPRAWLLVGTSFAVAFGFCLFAVLSYAFEEMQSMPASFRTYLVIYGAWALAIGGELSTPVCVFEIYRKLGTSDHSRWDWVALGASVFATLMVLFIAASSLLKVDATWPNVVQAYGPILLLLAAGADGYAGFMETGLYLRRFDRRHKGWEKEYLKWRQETAQQLGWAKGSQAVVVPTPAAIPLTPRPEPPDLFSEIRSFDDGEGGYCWCGFWCNGLQEYDEHLRSHLKETLWGDNGNKIPNAVAARKAMLERYKDTIGGARWEFLTLAEVRDMRKEAHKQGG